MYCVALVFRGLVWHIQLKFKGFQEVRFEESFPRSPQQLGFDKKYDGICKLQESSN